MPSISRQQPPAATARASGQVGAVVSSPPGQSLLAGAALVAMVLATYAPVFSADFIWDDHENVVTNGTLRSLDGLRQMWLVPRSIQQYYPLMYTSYWLEYHLWGLAPLGYHAVNVALHALAVMLVWRLLGRLQVPGAWLAAAMFAVHPVMVESVAWVTERKNVLSMSLALSSILCYLRFAPAEGAGVRNQGAQLPRYWYAASLALFALALAAKTVVVTLPPVLLVLQWWRNGRVSRRDLLAVLPYFLLAIAAGLITTWMETYHLGAHGKDWALTPLERFLLAGRALWFYAGKLAWPWPLAFFYPRFTIDAHVWWQYLFPLAAIALPVALWFARHRIGRGPLAAVLIYCGVLFPMLGFFNIYYALYAQVSDHFQYHACVAILALAAAGIVSAIEHVSPSMRGVAYAMVGTWLVVLAAISFRQTFIYHDLESLYRDTITKNPRGTIAYSNLGVLLNDRGETDEAIDLAREVLRLAPEDPLGHTNLAVFLLKRGQRDGLDPATLNEVIAHLREGLDLGREIWGTAPDEPRVRTQLGAALLQKASRNNFPPQDVAEAIEQLNAALRLDPTHAEAEVNLALAWAAIQQPAEAVAHAARALELAPQDEERLRGMLGAAVVAEAHSSLGTGLAAGGDFRAAAKHYTAAVRLRPDFDRAFNNLGVMMMKLGETERAIHDFEEAVRLRPDYDEARANLERAQKIRAEQSAPTK
jgi:tetratricopeptide (TPR) repeat protein